MKLSRNIVLVLIILNILLLAHETLGSDQPSLRSHTLSVDLDNNLVLPSPVAWRSGAISQFDVLKIGSQAAATAQIYQPTSQVSTQKQPIGLMRAIQSSKVSVQTIADIVPLKNIKVWSYRVDVKVATNRVVITVHF